MNPRELEILAILMKSEEGLTSGQVVNNSNGLSQSTVQTVLRKLAKMGLIEMTGVAYSGNVLSRTWKPTALAEEKILEYAATTLGEFKGIISKEKMIEAIYGE